MKGLLPPPLLLAMRRYRARIQHANRYGNLSTQEIFTKIYREGTWGGDPGRFCSGSGSRSRAIVEPYVQAVAKVLTGISLTDGRKPDAVDLGCGDFCVGSQLRAYCGAYVACDIVEPVMDANRKSFKDLDVDFRVLDISAEPLPDGDIVFIRQVLQHLSNDRITGVLRHIAPRYKYILLTEHLPSIKSFKPNLDVPCHHDTRLAFGSGVVLTAPPFNLEVREARRVCEVALNNDSIIRTDLYRLA